MKSELYKNYLKSLEQKYNAVCFDIDGTLLDHKTGRVPQSALDALKKVKEKGIKIVVSTGRIIEEIEKLPVAEIPFDAYLTLNGNICLSVSLASFTMISFTLTGVCVSNL